MGHTIRAGNHRLRRIDVFIPEFLARKDIVPAEIPLVPTFPEAAAPRKEIASSRLSLEEEIDQFYLEEEKEDRGKQVIPISDAEEEFDRLSGVRTLVIVVACSNSNSQEEADMALNLRRGLKDLIAGRNKGSSSKEVPKSQVVDNLPPSPPHPITSLGLIPLPNLKKKRKEQELEDGEVVP